MSLLKGSTYDVRAIVHWQSDDLSVILRGYVCLRKQDAGNRALNTAKLCSFQHGEMM